jgi:hypothetical protein
VAFIFEYLKPCNMKKLTVLLAAILAVAAACNNDTEQKTTTADTPAIPENKVMIPVSSCYANASKGDTVKMKVEVFKNVVTGTLSYQLKEKDSNKGEFEGQFHGDTLVADYRFMSEGKQSVRQIVFLIKDGVAAEGVGEMEEKDGKMVFKNTSTINFGRAAILEKEDCTY